MPTSRALKILVGVMVLMLLTGTAVLAVQRTSGPVTAVSAVTESALVSTTSTTYVDVPGMTTVVNVPDGQQALLIITFSGVSICWDFDNDYCFVDVRVDGTTASPGAINFDTGCYAGSGYICDYTPNSMQFVSGPVSAGRHVVKVRYRVQASGDEFFMIGRTLTVLRSKVG